MAERRGLTAPANVTAELQQIMREEAQEDTKEHRELPSNEGVKLPSLETVQEDRKIVSDHGGKIGKREGKREASQEGWREAVKVRAKVGSKEERKVRLNVDIPAGVHLQMKIWCLREGYNLNEVIPALVAQFLEGEVT